MVTDEKKFVAKSAVDLIKKYLHPAKIHKPCNVKRTRTFI